MKYDPAYKDEGVGMRPPDDPNSERCESCSRTYTKPKKKTDKDGNIISVCPFCGSEV